MKNMSSRSLLFWSRMSKDEGELRPSELRTYGIELEKLKLPGFRRFHGALCTLKLRYPHFLLFIYTRTQHNLNIAFSDSVLSANLVRSAGISVPKIAIAYCVRNKIY